MLDLVFQNLTSDKKYNSKFFEKILLAGIKELKLQARPGKNFGISVNLVGEGKIKELNRKYRKKNKVTDILSFPMSDKPIIHDSYPMLYDLGDIFICLPFAKKEAKRENINIEKELAQLTMHGFLHLCGYDHEASRQDAARMFGLENRILNKLAMDITL